MKKTKKYLPMLIMALSIILIKPTITKATEEYKYVEPITITEEEFTQEFEKESGSNELSEEEREKLYNYLTDPKELQEIEEGYEEIDQKAIEDNAEIVDVEYSYRRPSPFYHKKGNILVTNHGETRFNIAGHAGIVFDSYNTIEAYDPVVIAKGNNFFLRKGYGRIWEAEVRQADGSNRAVADWALKQKGKPYNWKIWDINTRARFYCSQLVYAGYKDKCGIDLNKNGGIVYPTDLINHKMIKIIRVK